MNTLRFAVDLLCYVLWFAAIGLLLKPRFRLLWTVLLELLCFVPYYWLSNTLAGPVSMLRTFLGLGLIIGMGVLFFEGKWYMRVLSVLLVMVMMLLSEFLTAALVPPQLFGDTVLADGTFPAQYYILYLAVQALLLTALVVTGRHLKSRSEGKFSTALPLLFLLFPLSQFVLLMFWYFPLRSGGALPDPVFTTVTILLCVAADIGLAILFRAVFRSADLKAQNRLLAGQLSAQEAYGSALEKDRQEIRRLKEDLARCPDTVRQLLEAGKSTDAAAFTEGLQLQYGRGSGLFPGCDNTVLAAFLAHRSEDLKKNGIDLQADVRIPSALRITDQDLICVFGNLLDNAAEACSVADDKTILLRAEMRSPYLSIETTSPDPPRKGKKHRRIPGLDRGLGFVILSGMAEKYDGEFLASGENGFFRTSLILKEEQQHAEDSHNR